MILTTILLSALTITLSPEVTVACRVVTSQAVLEAFRPKTARVVIPEACGITSQGKNGIKESSNLQHTCGNNAAFFSGYISCFGL